jgi:hypothetical protein
MRRICFALVVSTYGCIATPLDELTGPGDAPPDAAANLPPCVALSETVHPVFYRACAAWSDLPIAAVCTRPPPEDLCWAFDAPQRFDGYYCCCDSRIDSTCDPYH